MNPAFSIILFTTVSGLGYGLAVMLGLGLLDPTNPGTKLAHVLALGLVAAGLTASVFHLGNPQRAWRALSQWRSSWLSREGVVALTAFVPLTLSAGLALLQSSYSPAVGLMAAALSLASVYCTAMLYASLRAVDAWHTPLTPVVYLLLSLSGGAGAGVAVAVWSGQPARILLAAALFTTVCAWIAKFAWRRRMLSQTPRSTTETATGLGSIGRVRQFEPPHMTHNYLSHEMGFRIARRHAARLWQLAVFFSAVLPCIAWAGLLALETAAPGRPGLLPGVVVLIACGGQALGLLIERWLFFAEARHAVMAYYDTAPADRRNRA